MLQCQQAWSYSVSRHGAAVSAGMVLQCQQMVCKLLNVVGTSSECLTLGLNV